ncbi:hypothetical protein CH063_14245 [Colletotrichum higginsianum]|uniref:Uncharacterized protein n=1 Tax=Colletotrichum higginsianum (strain IMI 349063) TaxID=759273 RepID=H1VXS0_COLHI|nr:hypothetical protein CH063_12580 [Colletotrichum higginsianum]CCF45032.1 hypothetical protein CH063_14245 [Colletotrichum higginsianum]
MGSPSGKHQSNGVRRLSWLNGFAFSMPLVLLQPICK